MQLAGPSPMCLKKSREGTGLLWGKDTRLSGYMLETAIASGICSMGADVMLVVPSYAGIAFYYHSMRANAGVVISASPQSLL